MQIVGRQIEVGFAIESSRETPESVAQKWFKNVSADVIPRTQKVIDNNKRGVLEDSEGARVVREWFDGDVAGILHIDGFGYLLLNLYGQVATSTVSGSVKSHEFTMDQTTEHPTLSVFRKDGDVEQKVYGGGVINTLELSATTEDYVRLQANVIAGNEAENADTPSYDTEYDFIGRDITVKVADSEAGLGAASALSLKTVNIRFDTGAISDFVLGSRNPSNYNAKMGIEIEFSKNYVDTVFEDLFKADTYKYMQIKIEGEANLSGSYKPTITFVFNKVQVQSWERAGGADELVVETIVAKAFFNNTDSEQSKCTLQNLTESYVAGS
jgi:hypothetical protein